MAPEERFAFWQNELSRCIRCNACRNVCPACSCIKCVFDNDRYDTAQKANTTTFEEQMFHIIRAFHVAGRCTDCGECSRVCPQHIPLHLLNRKFIKDIDEFYGEYQAGEDTDSRAPVSYTHLDVYKRQVGFCMGVCNGFAIPVAQMFGAGDRKALCRYVGNGAVLAGILSVVMTRCV